MNYWKPINKQQRSLSSKVEEWMFRLIDVESQQRNRIQSCFILLNYLLSYAIIFFLIMQSLASQFLNTKQREELNFPKEAGYPDLTLVQTNTNDYKIITIFLLVRLGIALVYIIFQNLVFMMLLKALLIVNIFMSELESNQEEFISIELPLILLELAALSVWAYKIQRRIFHFDSRLNTRIPYAKDALIFITAFLIKRLQKITFQVTIIEDWMGSLNFTIYELGALQIIIICIFSVLFLDFNDLLYNKTFKSFLISLDFAFLALLLSWALSVHLTGKNIPYFNYLTLFFTIFCLQSVVLFRKEEFKQLYEIQSHKLDFQSQKKLINYFEAVRRLIKSKNLSPVQKNIGIIRFILFHRSCCLYPTCPFTKRYNMQDSIELKCQLIEEYMLKSLEKLSVTRPLLKKYIIFYLSPNDKIFRYLNQKQSYMKRQTWRIKQVKRQLNNQIRILQAEVTTKIVTELIEAYLTYGKRFFDNLMKETINCANLVQYGSKMIDLLDKFESIKANSTNFTQGVRVLINNFSTRLINDSKSQILETVIDPPFLIQKTTQSGPTMIVSAEPQNFLRIIDANIACTKEFYYPREVFLSVTVIDLLPDQIKIKHRQHFDQMSKKTNFDGEKYFPTSLFVINKNGFMSFFTAVVYLLNSIKGRMWCVAVQITHKMDAIMLVAMEKNGVVMGISQMAVFHGLKTTDKGKQLKQSFYKKLRTKIDGSNKYKCVIVDAYERIFDNSELEFIETKSFEIIQEYTAFGFSYFLVQIRSVIDPEIGAKGRSSILRSSVSIDNRNSNFFINDEQLNFVPKAQMFYHSDGVVRSYAQKSSEIFRRFDSLVKTDEEHEEMKGQLGNGITQMRLIDEQLDFLENIEQERDFLSKPKTEIQTKQQELKRFEMKEEFFHECYQQRKQIVPQWLKYTRIFMVLICILLIIILSVNYWYNSTRLDQIQSLQYLLNGISANLINYIKLSKVLLAAKYYSPSLVPRLKEFYDSINKEIQNSSQKMFSIDPNVERYFGQQQIDRTLSNYLIVLSDLTVSGNLNTFEEKSLLNDLILKITPAFNTLHDKKIGDFQIQNDKAVLKSFFLMIGFVSLLVAIYIWVIITRSWIQKKKQSILKILPKIKDSFIERELVKLQLFEHYLYFNHDIFCEDDLDYIMSTNQNKEGQTDSQPGLKGVLKRKFSWKNKKAQKEEEAEKILKESKGSNYKIMTSKQQIQNSSGGQLNQQQEGVLYIKKLINKQSTKGVLLLTMGWIGCMCVFSILFYQTVYKFATVSQKIFRISYNIQRMQSSADIVWILLNNFPYNQEQLEFYQNFIYKAEVDFKSSTISMEQDNLLSSDFLKFYQQIWTEDACSYIENSLPQCRTVLNGALMEGADQIIAYLNRKYDFLMVSQLTPEDFRSKESIRRISNIQLSYMTQIVKLNMKRLGEEHDRYADAFERDLFIYFLVSLVMMGCLGLVYKMLQRQNHSLIRLERMLKLVDFSSLKEMNEFKLYFKENYHDRLYK